MIAPHRENWKQRRNEGRATRADQRAPERFRIEMEHLRRRELNTDRRVLAKRIFVAVVAFALIAAIPLLTYIAHAVEDVEATIIAIAFLFFVLAALCRFAGALAQTSVEHWIEET
jgi:hypothetical protein